MDTYKLIQRCIQLENRRARVDEIRAYLLSEGVLQPMVPMIMEQALKVQERISAGKRNLLIGVLLLVAGLGITLAANGALLLYGAIGVGAYMTYSGIMLLRSTKVYRQPS